MLTHDPENDIMQVLTVLNNRAAELWRQGDLTGARQIEEEVLATMKRTFGNEHPNVLRAMVSLSRTLYDQGDLAGARTLEEQVLAIRHRTLGEKHRDTSVAAWSLFRTLIDSGEPHEAQKVFEADLLWLLDDNACTLAADQEQIRGMLIDIFRHAKKP